MKGFLLVISGPSGVGKGTVVKELLKNNDDLVVSISVTTRYRRSGEIDGQHYYFIDKDDFSSMIDNNELLEYAKVHNNYYGTPKEFVERKISEGKIVILEIDVQGALQIKENFDDASYIFIMPPKIKDIEKRLRKRATEDEDKIRLRLNNSKKEMCHIQNYDYFVINDEVDRACKKILEIIEEEREIRGE